MPANGRRDLIRRLKVIGRDIVALVRNLILVSLIAHMQEDFA